jgi:hypothetical protein
LRGQNKIFKKTITIKDNGRKIRLYNTRGRHLPHGSKLGPGLSLLGEGEVVKAPTRLRGGCERGFLDGRAPDAVLLAMQPDWLCEPTNGAGEQPTPDQPQANRGPQFDRRQSNLRFEYGEVRLEDVLSPPGHDEPDDDVVSSIAESQSGPFTDYRLPHP